MKEDDELLLVARRLRAASCGRSDASDLNELLTTTKDEAARLRAEVVAVLPQLKHWPDTYAAGGGGWWNAKTPCLDSCPPCRLKRALEETT